MNTWPPGRRLPGTGHLRPEFAVRGVAATDAVYLAVQIDVNSGAHAGVSQDIYAAVNGAHCPVNIGLAEHPAAPTGHGVVRQAHDHPVAGLPGLRRPCGDVRHPEPLSCAGRTP